MILERHLENLAKENSEYSKMFDMWKVIKNRVTSVLDNVSVYFPHFSLHNATHSQTICLQVGRLLGEERIQKLSLTDTFMLLLAFYMHDVGMALRYEDINKEFHKEEFREKLIELTNCDDEDLSLAAKRLQVFDNLNKNKGNKVDEYVSSIEVYNDVLLIIENIFRGQHAEKSAEDIKNILDLPKDIGMRFINIISDICRLHQQDIENIMKLPYKCNGIVDDYMHPRFIASMLCLGDLLDLDTDRFNENSIKTATPMPTSSKLHMLKHLSVKHFLVEPDGIEIISDSDSIDVYRVMKDWVKWIKDNCSYLAINWIDISPKNFGNAPHLKKCDLLINGSSKWLSYADLRFDIKNEKAFELLHGAGIYNNKFVCIREIIQNAIDATLLQFWSAEIVKQENKNGKTIDDFTKFDFNNYPINIDIKLNKSENVVVTIRDLGIGIKNEDLRFISQIGYEKNYNKIKLIETMPECLKPSGAFGMGIQSIFQVTDKFEIITKTDCELPKKIIFESVSNGKGYIIVEDYNESFLQGTQLSFEVDNSKFKLSDLHCAEYYYKTEGKGNLILQEINDDYNNILRGGAPIFEMRKQKYDYFPVEIKLQNIYSNKQETILKYEDISTFTRNLKEFEINENNIQIQGYDEVNVCLISISIILHPNNDEHKYSNANNIYRHKFGNALFYKNVFVCDDIVEIPSTYSVALFKNIDFSINVLSGNAKDLLTISRKSIKDNFAMEFRNICESAIEIRICKLIDYIINEKNDIGDIVIIIYQLAKYYNYKDYEFKNCYYYLLKKLQFNNYYLINNTEKTYSFDDLDKNNLFFIVNEVSEDVLNLSINPITDLTEKQDYCVNLDKPKGSKYGTHILYHKVERMFIGKINDKYYRILESKPFCFNKNGVICSKDDYSILDDVVCAFLYKLRCINVIKEFSDLNTPLKSKRGFKDYTHGGQFVIEIPFDTQDISIIREELINNGKIVTDKKVFYDKVINSKKFNQNIKYISEYQNLNERTIREKYIEFINKLLNLISNDSYSNYIKSVISFYNDHSNLKRGMYEYIEYSDYITYDV